MHHGAAGKKLIGAARHLFRGAQDEISPDVIDELRRSGAPDAVIKSYTARAARDNDYEVHADNWDALRLFQGCLTQWRRGGMNGARVGLDYVAVDIVARAKKIDLDGDVLDGLQIMEAESLRIFNAGN